jgi:hypothetical protein
MPIILLWNAAAGPFAALHKRLVNDLGVSGALIAKFLGKQLPKAEATERQTAGFPVFRFYDGAIVAEIGSLQRGVIKPAFDMTMAGQMERVGRAWNIPDYVRRRLREAALIPGLIDIFVTITQSVIDSIDRWAKPTAEHFDPANARITDLWGVAVLLFNRIGANRAGILKAGEALKEGIAASAPPPEPGDAVAGAAVAQASGGTDAVGKSLEQTIAGFTEQAEELLRIVTAALLVIPALGGLVLEMAGDILLRLRLRVLEECEAIEASVLTWRQDFFASFYRAVNAYVDGTMLFMLALRDHVLDQLRFFTAFSRAWISALTDGLLDFGDGFGRFWNGVADLMKALLGYFDGIMRVDIGDVLHNAFILFHRIIEFIGDEWWDDPDDAPRYEAPNYYSVGLGDFFTSTGSGATARTDLGRAGSTLRASLAGANMLSASLNLGIGSWISDIHLGALAGGVIRLTGELDKRRPGPIVTPGPLVDPFGPAPDIDAEFIVPARSALLGMTATWASVAYNGVGNAFLAVETFADKVADASHLAAQRALRLGSVEHYRKIVAQSEDFIRRAFPEAPSGATGFEAVAEAFSLWLSGSFEILGNVLNGYLAFLLDRWRNEVDTNEDLTFEATPTSPRKLLEKAQLGRVKIPEMRIVLARGEMSPEVANDVAETFRGAVRDAYSAGQRRLAELLEAAPAEATAR